MNRFFTNEPITNNTVTLTDDAVHHIKNVIKLTEGEQIVLVKNKKELLCRIDKIEKNSIIVYVVEELDSDSEPPYEITLFQGIAKGDKLDFIVEKAVEAGVTEIVPFKMHRSIAKIEGKDVAKKVERFQKIAKSAAQQCGRLVVPKVQEPKTPKQVDWDAFDLKLLCYEDENKTTLKEVLKKNPLTKETKKIALVIGPEGGISPEEVSFLTDAGFLSVSLGKRILRCETAGLYALANIQYELD
ncbi:MAG: 16S rRNA (uracil(1498)-N(3))-methyltransferase [Ruminococcaceae bacterium]|nr:16S rRNA (uracil(1498)-N(3))-methyltransferase [Oscillospiraceae bacterium]